MAISGAEGASTRRRTREDDSENRYMIVMPIKVR